MGRKDPISLVDSTGVRRQAVTDSPAVRGSCGVLNDSQKSKQYRAYQSKAGAWRGAAWRNWERLQTGAGGGGGGWGRNKKAAQ